MATAARCNMHNATAASIFADDFLFDRVNPRSEYDGCAFITC